MGILYKLNETALVKINTTYGGTENIEINEVVKQGTTNGPILCCASTARGNEIGEKAICKYGTIEIGMPVFMDDIAAVVDADTIRQRTPENTIWTEKAKYMTIITGRGKQG